MPLSRVLKKMLKPASRIIGWRGGEGNHSRLTNDSSICDARLAAPSEEN
jgi:hypothetical protein